MEFEELNNRKFKVWFKDMQSLQYKTDIRDAKIYYIEGNVDNFCPTAEVVFSDEHYGFNIIPFRSIVYMLEIRD